MDTKPISTPPANSNPQESAESLHTLTQEQYAAQFKQMDKEALYTLISAVVITIFFWGAIFLTHDIQLNVMHMPLWFVLSCLGGYLFSVVIVITLVKKFMRNLELKVSKDLAASTNKDTPVSSASSLASAATSASTAAKS